eukprot:scaffold585608_cov22-Prasinocladus_malaysianus.AAC.1
MRLCTRGHEARALLTQSSLIALSRCLRFIIIASVTTRSRARTIFFSFFVRHGWRERTRSATRTVSVIVIARAPRTLEHVPYRMSMSMTIGRCARFRSNVPPPYFRPKALILNSVL